MRHFFQGFTWARCPHVGRAAALAALVAGAGGCASPLVSSALRPVVLHQSWLQLEGGHTTEVSAGLFLELPRAPYRARFADAHGTYYQASQPLVYRTQQGAVTPVAGGLYVLHERPHEARSWTEPVFFTPTQVHPTVYPVRVFSGS